MAREGETMIVHLIRHGDTEATERGCFYGGTDVPVSAAGLGRLRGLRALGGYPDPAGLRVYTSGMLRTEQSLEALYGPIDHEALPELREMHFGAFEMRTPDELKEDQTFLDWLQGDVNANPTPGGESGERFERRVRAEFDRLLARGEDCLLLIHGGVISCILERFFPGERPGRYDWQPKPGTGYTLTFTDGAVTRAALPEGWAGRGYSFFQNKACEYFPCHAGADPESFNCLFCYCPLYCLGADCGGDFRILEGGVKDCSACLRPHRRENYGEILRRLKKMTKSGGQNGLE